tara:strand:+ start:1663 stop:1860 length:198 start_codon:yes stop_codon:yes gene_type:complete
MNSNKQTSCKSYDEAWDQAHDLMIELNSAYRLVDESLSLDEFYHQYHSILHVKDQIKIETVLKLF